LCGISLTINVERVGVERRGPCAKAGAGPRSQIGIVMGETAKGRGNCGKCAARVAHGHAMVNAMDRLWFRAARLEQGYRLVCRVDAKHEAPGVEIG